MERSIIILGIAWVLTGCAGHDPGTLRLETLDGNNATVADISGARATIFVFLDPVCPLSQNYTKNLEQLHQGFRDEGVLVAGIFPGDISAVQTREFIEKYMCSFPAYLDPDLELVRYFEATVTPEAILVERELQIRYRGSIDNWAIDLGKKRPVASAHYLEDALNDLLAGRPVAISETKPVGCFIERIN